MLSIPLLIQHHQLSSKERDAAAGPWKGWTGRGRVGVGKDGGLQETMAEGSGPGANCYRAIHTRTVTQSRITSQLNLMRFFTAFRKSDFSNWTC